MKHIIYTMLFLAIGTIATNAQTGNLTYKITDVSGKDVAAGHLTTNTSLAVNVPAGLYTLCVSGGKNNKIVKSVVIDEAEEINTSVDAQAETANNASIKNVTAGYIVVKIDNNGAFTCKKMLL